MLTQPDGSPQRGFSIRRFPSLSSTLAEVLLLNRVWPLNPWNRRYRALDFDYRKAQEVEQPAGACLAIQRVAWRDVQGMDNSFYPVWFEDVDLCRRLHERGWKILYCPSAVFVHAGGHSVTQLPFHQRQALWYGNLLRYFDKHESRWKSFILRSGIVAGMLLRCAASALGSRPSGVSFGTAVRSYCDVAWRYGVLGEVKQLHPNRQS
jgi:N-acetylglucosaminyl-diphospho-decaprenol L-rhamnosyltransferase